MGRARWSEVQVAWGLLSWWLVSDLRTVLTCETWPSSGKSVSESYHSVFSPCPGAKMIQYKQEMVNSVWRNHFSGYD